MTRSNRRNSCRGARLTANLCWIWVRNTSLAKWENSCTGARTPPYLCWKWAGNLTLITRKFEYLFSTYSLSLLNIASKRSKRRILYTVPQLTDPRRWKCARNFTRAKRRKSCIGNRNMCVLTLDILSFCTEYELENWLVPSEEICELALEPQSICAKYALETRLVQTAAYLGWKCSRPQLKRFDYEHWLLTEYFK